MTTAADFGPQQPQQFGRQFSLLVSNSQGKTIDLSQFRCKFSVKKSGFQTPNTSDILVYNLSSEAALFIKQEFTRVILQAGYPGNYGTIFKGNIKQAIIGRENATDTFLNLLCGDGDQAYNLSTLSMTIGSAKTGGASPANQLDAAINSMGTMGVGKGYVGSVPTVKLPRGKVMYGNARDYIKAVADTNNLNWSIQDENVVVVPESQYMPNEAVILTTKTGLIGTPQQTIEGIQAKCLLNPKIKCHTRIQIDNKIVAQLKIDFSSPGSPANTPVAILYDGYYFVWTTEHSGDTRGTEWYTSMKMLTVDASDNPLNNGGVQPNYG
jgi:hypothetical protein